MLTWFCNHVVERLFPLISLFQETVQLRKDRYVTCCCCCTSGPLTCALRLDRTGYVPGEDINLDAEIQNMSRKDITASYVTMQQVLTSTIVILLPVQLGESFPSNLLLVNTCNSQFSNQLYFAC